MSPVPDFSSHLTDLTPFLPAVALTTLNSTPTCRAAYNHVTTHLPTAILNHSIRTFLLSYATSPTYRVDLLYIAALYHDMGATAPCASAPCRFEVAGADAAASLLTTHSAPQTDIDAVWRAIALHTSAGIAERMGPPISSIRCAVTVDFGKAGGAELENLKAPAEDVWPRLGIEVCLADAVVEQVMGLGVQERREKAPPASWPGTLLAARLLYPGFVGVNPAF